MSTSVVQVRVDDDLKEQATEVYEALGMDLLNIPAHIEPPVRTLRATVPVV